MAARPTDAENLMEGRASLRKEHLNLKVLEEF